MQPHRVLDVGGYVRLHCQVRGSPPSLACQGIPFHRVSNIFVWYECPNYAFYFNASYKLLLQQTVTPRIPSPSPRTAPPASSTSSSREIPSHGSTTPPNARDGSSALPTRMDPPRPNAEFTSPARNRRSIVTCGRVARLRASEVTTRHLKL